MTNDDLLELKSHEPTVLLADGKFGMLVSYAHEGVCHVQVPMDELDTRRVPVADLQRTLNGAVRQIGAPDNPAAPSTPVQALLYGDFQARGGLTEEWY